MSDINMTFILNSAIERACHFLESSQWPGGFWIDFELAVGMSSQWVTGYVAQSLAQAGGSPQSLANAQNYLLRTQFNVGGWGFNRHVPPDADSTANVFLFFSRYCRKSINQTDLEKIANVLSTFHLSSDGGFSTYRWRPPRPGEEMPEFLYKGSGWCISHLSITAIAAEALSFMDKTKYKRIIEASVNFIKAQQTTRGYWNCYWWHGPLYGTYRASRVLSMMNDETNVKRAAEWLIDTCQEDGGWSNNLGRHSASFFTALAISTLLLLKEQSHLQQILSGGISWLLNAQQADGSWESAPILLTPIPQVQEPWNETDPSCHKAVPDQCRLFTTATVLSALTSYRDLLVSKVQNQNNNFIEQQP